MGRERDTVLRYKGVKEEGDRRTVREEEGDSGVRSGEQQNENREGTL